eukprot:m.73200 g.73200  ORF g.73200 m.73200 type:complete len:75 (+) comp35828_c0_seq2:254-478(+)
MKPYISFLSQCRPLSVSMGNAIKHIKLHISTIPPEKPEDEVSLCLFLTNNVLAFCFARLKRICVSSLIHTFEKR